MTEQERLLFREAVMEIARMVPHGRATSYGAIARAVGYSNLSRMVGNVMSRLGDEDGVPAHRVVSSQGKLTAHNAFGPGKEMAERLIEEGVDVRDNAIRNWKKVFWDPLSEIVLEETPKP